MKKSFAITGLFILLFQTQASAAKLKYWGGPTMSSTRVHLIWWGPPKRFPAGYIRKAETYFKDAARSGGRGRNVYSVLSQYPGRAKTPTGLHFQWGGSIRVNMANRKNPVCPRRMPSTCMGRKELEDALVSAGAKRRPGLKDFYVVMLPSHAAACVGSHSQPVCSSAWFGVHSFSRLDSSTIVWALITYQPLQSNLSWILLHEHMEALTNPMPVAGVQRTNRSGWMTNDSKEISDLCARHQTARQKLGAHYYRMPLQWSNHSNKCLAAVRASRQSRQLEFQAQQIQPPSLMVEPMLQVMPKKSPVT